MVNFSLFYELNALFYNFKTLFVKEQGVKDAAVNLFAFVCTSFFFYMAVYLETVFEVVSSTPLIVFCNLLSHSFNSANLLSVQIHQELVNVKNITNSCYLILKSVQTYCSFFCSSCLENGAADTSKH